ncbi:MAG: methylmalonyl-CoA mutase [Caulobacteraceae bacterium]|nr:methylmalonyl-CoA mutase [Caulobacteraceae bacterium]
MTETPIPLAEGFAPATEAAWRAAVEKTLKGAGPESLTSATLDGLAVRALYTAGDAAAPAPLNLPEPAAEGPAWDVRAAIVHPEISAAREQALEALAGGAASLLVKVGDGGVAIGSADDMAQALAGVVTDVAPVALDAGAAGAAAARWLSAAVKASPAAPLAFHMDPVGAAGVDGSGRHSGDIDDVARLAVRLAETHPRASLFLADGGPVHAALGSPAWELAWTLAAALSYARALEGAGLAAGEAFQRIAIGLRLDQAPLEGIAKLRAARAMWARATEACGVATLARIEARTSSRMLTTPDRWSNLVRQSIAVFAGAAGGADAIAVEALAADGVPADALAQRMARNIQLILMHEAHLGRVRDPAGGSWALETMTTDLARAAWGHLQAIERAGGIAAERARALVAEAVAASREEMTRRVRDRETAIVGVTAFRGDDPPAPPRASPERLEDLAA